jgi:hypothetical protein
LESKTTLRHKCKLKRFNHGLSTKCIGKWLLIINKTTFSPNYLYYTSSFLKGYFVTKKLQITTLDKLCFFFNKLFF